MSKYYEECNICNTLCDYRGRTIFVKFKCPTYFGTAGTVLDVKNNLLFLDYINGGISVTCCDNICYVVPAAVNNSVGAE
ncbi:MAG TPA: hypothetical protein PLV23_09600 [Sedimentibacter sp.]|jgi:hypothetical protein|nr:hypothetical protein [Sedimentibacter sp.]NMB98341.1 hypothetical protein [Clostridiaceae bacterium]HHZ00715.1 hypothetical protein [Tissierellia bacterium]HOK49394.1 hypothetical protein [Sedimentibacter sp.]HOW23867.1 hypothetical protein [Sedimentibacter sp.]